MLPGAGDDAYSASLVLLRESFDILSLCVLSLLSLLLSYSFHDGNFSKSLCLFWTETLCILDVSFSGDSTKFTTGTLILTVVFLILDFPFVDFFGPVPSCLRMKRVVQHHLAVVSEQNRVIVLLPRRTSVAQTIKPPVFGIMPLTALTGFFPRDASGGGRYITFDGGLKLICLYCPLRHKWAFCFSCDRVGIRCGTTLFDKNGRAKQSDGSRSLPL